MTLSKKTLEEEEEEEEKSNGSFLIGAFGAIRDLELERSRRVHLSILILNFNFF
jgi:hypothetical protein